MKIRVCPSTLKEGFDTYSPAACRALFGGKKVSPFFSEPSPFEGSGQSLEVVRQPARLSLSGVQPKFAVVADNTVLRYAREGEQGTHILKPRPTAYHILHKEFCAANENLTMQIASQAYGIETAANGLCFFGGSVGSAGSVEAAGAVGEAAYITRRFDVAEGGAKYPQEDFAALLGYEKNKGGSDFKYNSSYEECADVIRRYVKAAPIDLLRFFRLVLFNFITLNDDAHLKNFSLMEREGEYRLSPAYDLMNTALHLDRPRFFAFEKGLFKEGMYASDLRGVSVAEFLEFGRRIGLNEKVLHRELKRFSSPNRVMEELISRSYLSRELKKQYREFCRHRQKYLEIA